MIPQVYKKVCLFIDAGTKMICAILFSVFEAINDISIQDLMFFVPKSICFGACLALQIEPKLPFS